MRYGGCEGLALGGGEGVGVSYVVEGHFWVDGVR